MVREIADPVRWAFMTGVQLMHAGRASFLLRDNQEPVLLVAASVGIDASQVPIIRVGLGDGIAGIVAERGAHFFGVRGTTTFISVPVVTERGVEGVLNLTDRLGGSQFGDEHIAQAQAVADHIGKLLTYDRYVVYDSPSGLPNREAFEEMVGRELARSKRGGHPFAVASVRLLVTSVGVHHPENLLRGVGQAIKGALRRYDYASHLGDGEFALLLAVPVESVNEIGGRIAGIVMEVSRTMEADVMVAVGLARCPDDGTGIYDLMAVARRRMSEAES